jgi:hypothetical protein
VAAVPLAEAPVLAYLTVGLLAAVAFVVCLGMRAVWIHTFGYILTELADLLDFNIGFIHVHWGGLLRRVDHTVLNTLHGMARRSEHAMGYLFHGAAVIQGWVAQELAGLAHDVYGWAAWVQHAHLPRFVKAMIYSLVPPLLVPLIRRELAAFHPTHLTRVIHYRLGLSRRQVQAMIAAAIAGAGAIALPLPHVMPRLRDLERSRVNIWKRLTRLEKLLGVTAFAAAMARVLGLGSARCLRDGNIGRAARRWCGLDPSLVEALLADLALVAGTLSIVELAKETQRVAPIVATSLVYLADESPISVAEAQAIGQRALDILEQLG